MITRMFFRLTVSLLSASHTRLRHRENRRADTVRRVARDRDRSERNAGTPTNRRSRLWRTAAAIALPLGAGCSSFGPVDGQETAVNHVVQVGWDGNYYEFPEPFATSSINSRAGYERIEPCYFNRDSDACKQGTRDQFEVADAGFERIINGLKAFDFAGCECREAGAGKRVVVFVHGGLNTRESALQHAIGAAGRMREECIYPIFIVWRSSATSTLKDHYFRIRDGEISRIAPYTSPIYMVGDAFRTLGNAPIAWWKEGKHAWLSSVDREKTNEDLLRVPADYVSSVKIVANEGEPGALRTVQWWVTSPFKIVTTPMVYSLGQPAWDNMQRRVDTQLVKPIDLLIPDSQIFSVQMSVGDEVVGSTGATLRFMARLQRELASDPDYELTLIGHSMGSILVNRILRYLPELPVTNAVHMASADTLENLLQASGQRRQVAPALAASAGSQGRGPLNVYSLHLHPENEDRETQFWGIAPSGSLLVWIDNAFGAPDYTLQRTAGRWSNMRQALPQSAEIDNATFHYTVFGKASDETAQPQQHGAFNDAAFRYWDRSFWGGSVEPFVCSR